MDSEYKIDQKELARLIAFCRDNKYAGAHRPLTFAAILLGQEHFDVLSMFYTFFCYCDDEIDQVQTIEQSRVKLEKFHGYYARIVKGDKIYFDESPPFAAMQYAMAKYNIPLFYFENLFSSMKMDINNHIYQTVNDLILYCYLATGLGMAAYSYVVGVNHEEGVHYAMYYGISSQLTNSARDILVDAKIGRVYVPLQLLEEQHIPLQDITNPIYQNQIHNIAKKLANLAGTYMKQGDKCLPFFSFSTACTLALARQLDTTICNAICNKDIQSFEKGISISLWKKLILVPIAIARVVKAQRLHIFKRFKPVPIHKIWDFQSQHGDEENRNENAR